MPSKYPTCTPEEVLKALLRIGFVKIGQKGSHVKLSNNKRIVIIPMHCKDLKLGTFKGILEQAGLSVEELMRFL